MNKGWGGQVSCRVSFHSSILTLPIIPSSPISTSFKTYLKTFLFLSLPFYYHNMNIITVLLFHYFLLLLQRKGLRGRKSVASLRRGSASKPFFIFSACHLLIIIALKFSFYRKFYKTSWIFLSKLGSLYNLFIKNGAESFFTLIEIFCPFIMNFRW